MMLTSSNQYLRPEYLSPLPTTLDAKKSPLALLAQTCSNIGADTPNNKPIIPPIEKPKDKDSAPSKLAISNGMCPKDSSSRISITNGRSSTSSSPANASDDAVTTSSQSSTTSSSVNSAHKCFRPFDFSDDKDDSRRSPNKTPVSTSSSPSAIVVSASSPRTSPLSPLKVSECSTSSTSATSSTSTPHESVVTSTFSSLYKPNGNLVVPSPLNCVGCTSTTTDPTTAFMTSHPGYSPLKLGAFAAAMSPYLGVYSRVKTPTSAAAGLLCRDPYCTNCQYPGLHGPSTVTCPAGCTQCKHEPGALNPLLAHPGLYPTMAAAPGLSLPYVCNWIAGGDSYCGKRFTTSEELLQHLRSHTSFAPGTEIPPPPAACHIHPAALGAHPPSLTSPAGLRRTYPSPLDTLTAAAAASSRYHPYKPVTSSAASTGSTALAAAAAAAAAAAGTGGMPPLGPLAHPALSPYYSPYSIYGQRFGAAVHP